MHIHSCGSSRSLGQVETAREKRRREMHFAKTGLVLQHSDQPLKRLVSGNDSCEIELDSSEIYSDPVEKEDTPIQTMNIDTEILDREIINVKRFQISSPEPPYIERGEDISALEAPSSVKELDHEHTDTLMIEDPKTSLPSSSCNSVAKPMMVVSSTNSVTPMPKSVAVPTVVRVSRPKDVESKRMDLPIVMMEQEIMEAIYENISIIICGETRCVKTTQVPQFLYEAGFGSKSCGSRSGIIGVTQPRRVAVLATARRVAFELGVGLGKEVGFQVDMTRKLETAAKSSS